MDTSTEHHQDGRTAIRVTGEVDLYTASHLQQALDDALDGPAAGLLLDLSQVTFMDSHALGVVVGSYKRHLVAGRPFSVVADHEPVRSLFRMTGLHRVLPLDGDVGGALAAS